jgi:hypothetical protein
LRTGFRKISRIRNLTGTTKWYLSEDCLLAAKRVMYAVEYRRFYLRDLESIVVWHSRTWLLRPAIPGVLFLTLGAMLWSWVNFTAGLIAVGAGLVWAGLEVWLGPTAQSLIRTTGASVDMPLVKRTRGARKVLAKIDAAVRATRGGAMEQPTATIGRAEPATPSSQTNSESVSAAAPIGDVT